MREPEIRARVSAMMPEILADLERLVAIPSIAFPGYPPDPVNEMAAETLGLFRTRRPRRRRPVGGPERVPTRLRGEPDPLL
jgi:hypothetical protein